jgi:hypothetical protein
MKPSYRLLSSTAGISLGRQVDGSYLIFVNGRRRILRASATQPIIGIKIVNGVVAYRNGRLLTEADLNDGGFLVPLS